MNEQFYQLPKEKQMRIINAGMEVFAQYDYKHASTDEMARKAGISKGLLFYYFHNKKSFYVYLFQYSSRLLLEQIMDDHFKQITDFFELIEYAAQRKVAALGNLPYLTDFVMRCYYAEDGEAGTGMGELIGGFISNSFEIYFSNVDFSKFRDDVPPKEVYDMLTWMTTGYLYDRKRAGKTAELGEVMEHFHLWKKRLKKISYKEEYQEGGTE